jgi:hypothetical protein
MVVIPFENTSPDAGPGMARRILSRNFSRATQFSGLYVASREERLRAYDRQGVPAGVHASRATLYRLAEQMDVDYAVLGSYRYDGAA